MTNIRKSGIARYELSTQQWRNIKDLLPKKIDAQENLTEETRNFINAVLWILRSGVDWYNLPKERYGDHATVYARFVEWDKEDVWERIFGQLLKDPNNHYLMLDYELIKAHTQAAMLNKKIDLWRIPEDI